jgi:hypothetical protein
MVVHVCNPSYLGGRHRGNHGSRPVGIKVSKILSQKQAVVVHACNSSNLGGRGVRFVI